MEIHNSPQEDNVEPAPIKARVFANTGHHFLFAAFTDSQLRSEGQRASVLQELCQNNSFPWRQACDARGAPVRWILYRFGDVGLLGNHQYGLVFAIETNLGTE